MRLLRSALNACLRALVADDGDDARAVDGRVLRRLARIGSALGVPDAGRLGEPWMLDALRILARGIAETPYGAALALPYPLVVSLSTANSCAMGCSHCYSASLVRPPEPTIVTTELAATIARSPVPIVFVTGGEPFHHPRLAEVLAPVLARGKKVLIATNAPAARVADTLLPYRGQVTIVLSQWGGPARNDAVRGRGNRERTWRAAERLARSGHRVALNYVLGGHGLDAKFAVLEEIVAGAPHVHRFYVSRELLVGRVPAATVPAATAVADVEPLRRRMAALTAAFPGRIVPMLPELRAAGERSTSSRLTRLLGIGLPASCGAGAWTLHVDAAGRCHPCFAHEGGISTGDLSTDDLESVWRRAATARRVATGLAGEGCWAEKAAAARGHRPAGPAPATDHPGRNG